MDDKTRNILVGIGDIFRQTREDDNLGQRDIASKIGSAQARVSDLENGRTDAKISTIVRYAEFFGYDVEISFVPIKQEEEEEENG
jgi:transcriptional regulator with XRE-family HTH domain